MFQVLLGAWKKRIKIVEDESLFKTVFLGGLAVLIIVIAACEIYLMRNKEYFIMLLLGAFLVIYNKPTILCSMIQRKNASFMLKKAVFFRFAIFQILRENVLIVVFSAAQIPVFLYALYSIKFAVVLAMWVFAVDIYLLDIYQREKKLVLLLLGACICGWTISYNMWVLLLMVTLNVWYIYGTFHKEVITSIFINRTRDVLVRKKKLSIRMVNSLFFLRMPFQEILQFLFAIILVCVARQFAQVDVVFYLFIAVVLVDMELIQDDKMKNYDHYYGKSLFLSFTQITGKQKFLLSVEFCYAMKYMLLSLPLLVIEIHSHLWDLYFGFEYINILVLIVAISIRYYHATECALNAKKLIEHTWFRMVMLYLVLFDLTPILFKSVLLGLDWYEVYYGCIFSACVTMLVLFAKIENIVKVTGEGFVEKRE